MKVIEEDFPRMRGAFGEDFNAFIKRYYPECYGKENEEIMRYFREKEDSITKKIKRDAADLKREWMKVEEDVFAHIENITGSKFKRKNYVCYLSSTTIWGGSYEIPDKILVFPSCKHSNPVLIIAHELTHLLFWEVFKTVKKTIPKDLFGSKLWDFSEVVTNFILLKIKLKGFDYKSRLWSEEQKRMLNSVKSKWNGDLKSLLLDIEI